MFHFGDAGRGITLKEDVQEFSGIHATVRRTAPYSLRSYERSLTHADRGRRITLNYVKSRYIT